MVSCRTGLLRGGRAFARHFKPSAGPSVGRQGDDPDQREGWPKGYTRHEVTSPRVVGLSQVLKVKVEVGPIWCGKDQTSAFVVICVFLWWISDLGAVGCGFYSGLPGFKGAVFVRQ